MKNIELEIRAEVGEAENLFAQLKEEYELISHTERLSVMFFGETDAGKFDIRVRVTNGNSEVVVKKGGFHVDDRIEEEQNIHPDQFTGFVRQFTLLEFFAEVAARETYNFLVNEDVTLSLVQAGDIAYVEIEKMTNEDRIAADRKELYEIAQTHELDIIENKEDFEDLCDRLSEKCDWEFSGTDADYKKLSKALEDHLGQYR